MTRSMYVHQAASYRAVDGLRSVGLVDDEPDGDDDGVVHEGRDIRADVSVLLQRLAPTIPSSPSPVRNPRTVYRPSPLESTPSPRTHCFFTDAPSTPSSYAAIPSPASSVVPLPHPIPHTPSSSSPVLSLFAPTLNKRQRQNLTRRLGFRSKKLAKAHIEHVSDARSSDQTKKSPYSGFRKHGNAPAREVIIIPMGDGDAAALFDADGRLAVYRPWCPEGSIWHSVNNVLIGVADKIRRSGIPPTFKDGMRGEFSTFAFSLHRGSQADPVMSAYFRKHEAFAQEIMDDLEPVRLIASGIFKSRMPGIYQRYRITMDFVQKYRPGTRPCFDPWASFCINMGLVISDDHKDLWNLLFGLCLIIPFGFFDFCTCARLGIKELGVEFEVAPGVPIWVPSAMYTHYNTELKKMGMRQSLVAWTGAPIFQWKDLDGRALAKLSPSEKAEYVASLPRRIAEGLTLFPLRSDFEASFTSTPSLS